MASNPESSHVIRSRRSSIAVMAGLRPGHPRLSCLSTAKTWMPGTGPGMTNWGFRVRAEGGRPGMTERLFRRLLDRRHPRQDDLNLRAAARLRIQVKPPAQPIGDDA